jgi:FkbM family methyltransferase
MDVPAAPSSSWVGRLKTLAARNRPSQKPQLWEDLALGLRRRVELELAQRLDAGWLDRRHVVRLSRVGFEDGAPPLRMTVVPREMMNKSLFLYGTLEISETRIVQALLAPGMCFVDVGANIGYYALLGARIVGPSGAVHAFEPNGEVRTRLVENLELNGLANVVVYDKAVTRRSGTVRFYTSTWVENSGISSILPGAGRSEQGEEVACVSLDDFVATLGPRRIDLLKMDIEGAELEAIEGGRDLLSRADAPAILFEAAKVEPLAQALRGFGYSIRRLDYSLSVGLELIDAGDDHQGIFSSYEAPNYFATKDGAQFAAVVERANARRQPALRLLGAV